MENTKCRDNVEYIAWDMRSNTEEAPDGKKDSPAVGVCRYTLCLNASNLSGVASKNSGVQMWRSIVQNCF